MQEDCVGFVSVEFAPSFVGDGVGRERVGGVSEGERMRVVVSQGRRRWLRDRIGTVAISYRVSLTSNHMTSKRFEQAHKILTLTT